MPKLTKMRIAVLYVLLIFFFSCSIKTTTLENGLTKVALNKNVYKNISKFEKNLLDMVDTSVVYESFTEKNYYGINDSETVNIVDRLNFKDSRVIYSCYKFYDNGKMNLFILNRNDSVLTQKTFDPNYNGYRGIYYRNKNKILGDLITRVTGYGRIGKSRTEFEFVGDTLFVYSEPYKHKSIYLKRKIQTELLEHKAEW